MHWSSKILQDIFSLTMAAININVYLATFNGGENCVCVFSFNIYQLLIVNPCMYGAPRLQESEYSVHQ